MQSAMPEIYRCSRKPLNLRDLLNLKFFFLMLIIMNSRNVLGITKSWNSRIGLIPLKLLIWWWSLHCKDDVFNECIWRMIPAASRLIIRLLQVGKAKQWKMKPGLAPHSHAYTNLLPARALSIKAIPHATHTCTSRDGADDKTLA